MRIRTTLAAVARSLGSDETEALRELGAAAAGVYLPVEPAVGRALQRRRLVRSDVTPGDVPVYKITYKGRSVLRLAQRLGRVR